MTAKIPAPEFFLSCTGSLSLRKVVIALWEHKDRAIEEAKDISASLYAAGYFNFYLYDSESNEVGHFKISRPETTAEFRVATKAA